MLLAKIDMPAGARWGGRLCGGFGPPLDDVLLERQTHRVNAIRLRSRSCASTGWQRRAYGVGV